MKPYVPSKMCPHRCCRALHTAVGMVGGVILGISSPMPIMQALGFLAMLVLLTSWWIRRRYGAIATPRYEKPNQYLIVRRGWARAALAGDLLIVFFVLLGLMVNLSMRAAHVKPSLSDGNPVASIISTALMSGTVALVIWCHWMATRPGKPKRVRVPRGAVFGGA